MPGFQSYVSAIHTIIHVCVCFLIYKESTGANMNMNHIVQICRADNEVGNYSRVITSDGAVVWDSCNK